MVDAAPTTQGAFDRGPTNPVQRLAVNQNAARSALPALVGLGLAAAVVFPWAGGRIFLLDWVTGPHEGIVPLSLYGLGGGLPSGAPLQVVVALLAHVAPGLASWLPIAAFFPLATTAMARLVGGPPVRQVAAGVLYAVNPFVFDRLYAGQLALLLGYALLPAAARSLERAAAGEGIWVAGALWAGGCVALDAHLAWILVPLAIGMTAVHRHLRSWGRLLGAAAGAFALNAYLLATTVTGGTTLSPTASQLAAYATRSDPRVGVYVNVAGLYGFWRPGPVEPKDLYSGWPALLAAVLIVAGLGHARALRTPVSRRTAMAVLAAGGLGFLLALGAGGPMGGLFRLAYLHLPGFGLMREAEKFSGLVALAYAFGFGHGVEALASFARREGVRRAAASLAVVVPLAYAPNLVDGLGGQIQQGNVPAAWTAAARVTAGSAPVLVLPWCEYLATPAAGGRVVANLAGVELAAPVLESQAPGARFSPSPLDAQQLTLDRLLAAKGRNGHDAAQLALLGVHFVVLEKGVPSWRADRWLAHVPGIRPVLDRAGIEVLAVDAGGSFRSSRDATAKALRMTTAPGRKARAGLAGRLAMRPVSFARQSPVAYRIGAGPSGWALVPLPFQSGWQAEGHAAVALPDGDLAVRVTRGEVDLSFSPWYRALALDLASVVALMVLAAVALRQRAPRRHGRLEQDGSSAGPGTEHSAATGRIGEA